MLRRITLAALALSMLAASPVSIPIDSSSTGTGINATVTDDLSATLVTNAIDMHPQQGITNQLSLTLAVTPGTTTTFTVQCFESESSAAGFAAITVCDGNASAACGPDIRTYTMSQYTAVGGVKYVSSRWQATKRYVKCTLDDAGDGTGTVTVTGTRSYQ